MSYYLDTIEQIKNEDGTYTEYGKREKKATYQEALTAFYTKLTNVSNSSSLVPNSASCQLGAGEILIAMLFWLSQYDTFS